MELGVDKFPGSIATLLKCIFRSGLTYFGQTAIKHTFVCLIEHDVKRNKISVIVYC